MTGNLLTFNNGDPLLYSSAANGIFTMFQQIANGVFSQIQFPENVGRSCAAASGDRL